MYERLRLAYEDSMARELESAQEGDLGALPAEHLRRTDMTRGLARVAVDVLLVPAFDFERFCWRHDGWKTAEQAALRMRMEAGTSAWKRPR